MRSVVLFLMSFFPSKIRNKILVSIKVRLTLLHLLKDAMSATLT